MSFESSIPQMIQEKISNLIDWVSDETKGDQTAHEVETQLWWDMLSLGQQLMQLYFDQQEQLETRHGEIQDGAKTYPYIGQKKRDYVSLFGKVTVRRAAYWQRGEPMQYPLDEQLSLPERSFSDLVQERLSELTVLMPYDDSVSLFTNWLGWSVSKRSSQQVNTDHATEVSDYYEAQELPDAPPDDRILVVSADGKGIPMTRKESPAPKARRGRGQKKTAKKEATVTAVYTIAPYQRNADDIIRALVPDENTERASSSARPTPTHKQLFGTLAGQTLAFEQLAQQVDKRDAQSIDHYVALTDGNRGLKKRVQEDLPHFTLIVDIIHVTEYLWTAATLLWGETHPMREVWMRDALRCVLDDDLDQLLNHLNYQLTGLTTHQQKTLQTVIRYLNNNREYMHYQTYLTHGYPIATGVIEGACRHLVKDRFERSGMRWSREGAQVMLDLRAVYLNGDWDDFQRFRRQQAHQKRYASLHPNAIPEERVLGRAA